MTPEHLFSIANPIAMTGWIFLIAAPRKRWASVVAGRAIPLLLSAIYLLLLCLHWGEGAGGFGSLHDVALLFSNPWVLLAGWIHYLAFDLFTGAWEVRDALKNGVSHWLLVPCLLLTFMFGPAGLLTYFCIRTAVSRLQKGKL